MIQENQLELEMQQLLQEAQDAAEEAGSVDPGAEEAVPNKTAEKNINVKNKSSTTEKAKILDASKRTEVNKLSENRNKLNSGLIC